MIIDKKTIENFEQRYRTTFINSLAGFRQAVLVGTQSETGVANLAIFNSLIHLGANPALFGMISRPDIVPRDTLRNIMSTGQYSLNYIKTEHYQKAHQTSARYDKSVSEFDKTGFTAYYQENFKAPFVKEAEVKIGMQLEECIPIALNGTILIIGSLVHIDMEDSLVGGDGFVNLSDLGVLVSQGLDAYFETRLVGRLPYAKP
jgi:flavin reductase (DIM6/NTAB) family NADH-FMN oxidoreductase RutF